MPARNVKCPKCGGPVNTGSMKPALIDPGKDMEDKVWLHFYYCQKTDEHMFAMVSRKEPRV